MRQLLLAASVFALCTGSATAQDAAYDWSGVYLGVQAGHGWGSGGMNALNLYTDTRPNGMLGGFYAGYNYQFANRLVLGIDADFAWHDAIDMGYRQQIGAPPIFSPNGMDRQDVIWTAALRARAGYAADRWMPYFSFGKEWAKVDQLVRNLGNNFHLGTTTFSGWTAGAGVEFALKDNISLRADYRYSDFGDKTLKHPSLVPINWRLKTHDLRLGIAVKF